MEMPSRLDVIPTKCAKCGSERIKRQQLSMHSSRWGFLGRAYIFDVYSCQDCSYSELFFKKASWL